MNPRTTAAAKQLSREELAKREAATKLAVAKLEKRHIAECNKRIAAFEVAREREAATLLKNLRKLIAKEPRRIELIRNEKLVVSAVLKAYPNLAKFKGWKGTGDGGTTIAIASVQPAEVEVGTLVSVMAPGFNSDYDKVYLTLPGKGDVQITNIYDGDEGSDFFAFFVPDYDALDYTIGYISIESEAGRGPGYAVRFRPNVPVISSISPTEGQPGMPVLISGRGFQNPVEVHFVVGQGRDEKSPTLDYVSSTQILAYVPNVSGIASAFPGVVYVTSAGKKSNAYPFTFQPKIVQQRMNIDLFSDQGVQFAKRDDDDTWWVCQYVINGQEFSTTIAGKHLGGIVTGCKDNDSFFNNIRLSNNWVVEDILLTPDTDDSNASIAADSKQTDSPWVKVHWWCGAGGVLYYYVSWIIKGPDGVPYK